MWCFIVVAVLSVVRKRLYTCTEAKTVEADAFIFLRVEECFGNKLHFREMRNQLPLSNFSVVVWKGPKILGDFIQFCRRDLEGSAKN